LTTDDALRAEIKQALVRSLRLPIAATEIDDDISLFGEGLGLDSIVVLELVHEVDRTFGASISDEETGKRVLRTVISLLQNILALGGHRRP